MFENKRKIFKPVPEMIIGYLGLLLFLLSPNKLAYPATVLCLFAFVFARLIWPECRFKIDRPLCPLNISQMLFWVQLLIFPILGVLLGYSIGSLPWPPSDLSINISLLITAVAYLSFCGSYHYLSRRKQRPPSTIGQHSAKKAHYPFKPMTMIAFTFLGVGLFGFYLFFDNINDYITYLLYPTYVFTLLNNVSGTFRGAASNFLRPFLGVAFILFWSMWVDRKGNTTNWRVKALLTVFISLIIFFINISYSYNRGAVFSPIIAMVAAFSSRVRRISMKFVVILGIMFILVSFVWGAYRSKDLFVSDLVMPEQVFSLVEDLNIVEWLQVYGSAPQFTAFFSDEMGLGSKLYLGQTLISSLLYPVTILGKAFRSTSGVVLYNQSVYGYPGIVDQIVPLQAELFINFHVLGVIAGFGFLAYLIVVLQKAFENARNCFEAFSFFYISIWTVYVIVAGLSVTSQIYLYFFWPLYFYFLIRAFGPRPSHANS